MCSQNSRLTFLVFALLVATPASDAQNSTRPTSPLASCPPVFASVAPKSAKPVPEFLNQDVGRLVEQKNVLLTSTVTAEDQRIADELISQITDAATPVKSFEFILLGGKLIDVATKLKLPPALDAVTERHMNTLRQRLEAEHPNFNVIIKEGSIRIANNGDFVVPHLHLDTGGFHRNVYTTSTSFSADSAGTVVADSQHIASRAASSTHGSWIPLEVRNSLGTDWIPVADYGIEATQLQQISAGDTLVLNRFAGGTGDISSKASGRRGEEIQHGLVYNSGIWHSSPDLLPGAEPRRFWIGLIFELEPK